MPIIVSVGVYTAIEEGLNSSVFLLRVKKKRSNERIQIMKNTQSLLTRQDVCGRMEDDSYRVTMFPYAIRHITYDLDDSYKQAHHIKTIK